MPPKKGTKQAADSPELQKLRDAEAEVALLQHQLGLRYREAAEATRQQQIWKEECSALRAMVALRVDASADATQGLRATYKVRTCTVLPARRCTSTLRMATCATKEAVVHTACKTWLSSQGCHAA
jgi:hypothetical protein